MIIELEDFAKWCAIQEWAYIKEQFEDGEKNFIDSTTHNHKDFVLLWEMIGDFRRKHGLPYVCYDPEGKEITEARYYEILKEYVKKYGVDE